MEPKRLHTHYDNLKVSRHADAEEIRKAYRTLCRQYHPDRNPDDPEAERIMRIINRSYAVLRDPVERQKHDAWIDAQNFRQPEKISSPMPKPEAVKPNMQPYGKLVVWLLLVALFLVGITYFTAQQRRSDTWRHEQVLTPPKVLTE